MGLFDFILKKSGKVGGTARWVAEEYKAVRKNNPKLSHLEILERVNTTRCAGYKDSYIIDSINRFVYDDDEDALPKGLLGYVFRIIQAESCMSQLPSEVGIVIGEELRKAGIENDIISIPWARSIP